MAEAKPNILPHLLVAAGVLGIGGLAVWQTLAIPKTALFVAVGPAVIPWVISLFLVVTGLGLVIAAFRGGWAHDQDGTITEWGSLAYVMGGLVLNAGLIEHIGFILASTLMFVLVSRGFESRSPLRDGAIGFGLALVAYIGFDRILGYKIGSGLIERLI